MKRKFNVKRVIACAAAAMLAVTAFTGCGQSKDEEAEGVTTVTYWSSDGHLKAGWEKLFDEYNSGEGKEKGIKIEYTYLAGESYGQNLELALQNGTAPDIYNPRGGDSTRKQYAESGYIAAIDDMPGGKEFLETYDGMLQKSDSLNGKYYSVPICYTVMGLIYNTEMFKQAGLVDENGNPKTPKTFDELREYAKILTDESKEQYGIIFPRKWSGWGESDIRYVSAGSTGDIGYDYRMGKMDFSKQAEILQYYMDIEKDGSCFPGDSAIDNDAARAYFAEGNIGMKIAFSFDVGVLTDQFPAKIDWDVAPLPVLDETQRYPQRLTADASPWINAKSLETKDPEKIMEVYKFLCGDMVAKYMYEEGLRIPVKPEIAEEVEFDSSMKQWKSFGDLVQEGGIYPAFPMFDAAAIQTYQDAVISIMSGDATPEEGFAKLGQQIYDAMVEYDANNSDYSMDDYKIPDWNPILKNDK